MGYGQPYIYEKKSGREFDFLNCNFEVIGHHVQFQNILSKFPDKFLYRNDGFLLSGVPKTFFVIMHQ